MKYQTFIQQAKDFKQLDFDGMNKIIGNPFSGEFSSEDIDLDLGHIAFGM